MVSASLGHWLLHVNGQASVQCPLLRVSVSEVEAKQECILAILKQLEKSFICCD